MQNIIAVIFDFDETLAPDSTTSFLESVGIDTKTFWHETVPPLLKQGWDPVPAYLHLMLEAAHGEYPMTRSLMQAHGKQVKLYPGATSIFGKLSEHAKAINPHVELEFYLISSGIADILRHTKVAKQFSDIWACEFEFDAKERPTFPKRIVSFTDKTRYLFHIAKGILGEQARQFPFEVNRKVAETQQRVPFDQMIFVGDGYTDIPCFSLVKKEGGVAFGVYDPEHQSKWGRAWGFLEDERVTNLAAADYTSKATLTHNLLMAVESIASKIEVRLQSYGG